MVKLINRYKGVTIVNIEVVYWSVVVPLVHRDHNWGPMWAVQVAAIWYSHKPDVHHT